MFASLSAGLFFPAKHCFLISEATISQGQKNQVAVAAT